MRLGCFGGGFNRRLIDLLAQAKGNILVDGPRKEENILFDGRDLRAQRIEIPVAHIDPIDQDAPFVHIVGAVDQLGQRGLARTGLADDRNRLAGRGAERDIAQHRQAVGIVVQPEGDVIKDNLTAHGRGVTGLVLIQLGLFFHQLEDAPGAGNAHLHQRKGEDGDKGRKAQDPHQPHVGHQLTNG